MSNYDNDLRGALFRNDRKEKDSHPDYKGQCEIEGVEYWVSAWIKQSKAGAKFMSLSFEQKDKPKPAPKSRPKDERYQAGMPDDDLDPLPF